MSLVVSVGVGWKCWSAYGYTGDNNHEADLTYESLLALEDLIIRHYSNIGFAGLSLLKFLDIGISRTCPSESRESS